ncbi:hypothetical protein [Plantactinospora sp. CA-290183]|uniref:hypothetical protein n=1 Tax=Plantactinospora sp. CA-290183 TaxID=3240006 RepID=UPI003D92DBF2
MRTPDTNQTNTAAGRSRRTVVRTAALVALAGATGSLTGCGLLDNGPDRPPAPDPLVPLIPGALELAGRHEAAIAAFPELDARLRPIAQAHREHAAELARVTGTALPSTTATAAAPGASAEATLRDLRTAEQQAREAAATACAAAPAARAALVGSIAAARASHAEVVR